MRFEEFNRDTVLPKNADYILEKTKEFYNLLPFMNPKINGEWRVVLLDIPLEEIREIKKDISIPEYVDIVCYMRKELLGILYSEDNSIDIANKTSWERYKEIVNNNPVLIEPRAVKELYKRSARDLNAVKEVLKKLTDEVGLDGIITLKHIKDNIIYNKPVYARDVVLTLLVKHATIADAESKYKYFKFQEYFKLAEKLVDELGQEYAFYAIRKYIDKLFKEKNKYLSNKECKEADLFEIVSIYDILHAHVIFQLSKPYQLFVCLEEINKRESNGKSNIEEIILEHY